MAVAAGAAAAVADCGVVMMSLRPLEVIAAAPSAALEDEGSSCNCSAPVLLGMIISGVRAGPTRDTARVQGMSCVCVRVYKSISNKQYQCTVEELLCANTLHWLTTVSIASELSLHVIIRGH